MSGRRRIVGCKSCRKRFITSSALCLSCRPKEVAPELTYGGDSLSISPGSQRRDAKCDAPADESGSAETTMQTESLSPQPKQSVVDDRKRKHCAISSEKSNEGAEERSTLPIGHHPLNVQKESGQFNIDKRTHPAAQLPQSNDDFLDDCENPCTDGQPNEGAAAPSTALESTIAITSAPEPTKMLHEEHTTAKKRRVESETTSSNCSGEFASAHDAVGTSTENLSAQESKRLPKVSIGSITNGSCSSQSEDEIDAMIAQESIWSKKRNNSAAEAHGIDTDTGPNEDDSDDSDIECLGTSSEYEVIDESQHHNFRSEDYCPSNPEMGSWEGEFGIHCDDKGPQYPGDTDSVHPESSYRIGDGNGNCVTEGIDSSLPESELVGNDTECMQANSPKKDVCYICGTDLTRLSSGLKGRVAHMKRCSAKYGKVLGGRSAMNNDGEFDADFVDNGADNLNSNESSDATPKQASKVPNPYDKTQWHGDAGSELDLHKSISPARGQAKQTMLNKFFKKPVRSLTNVLMAGARQVAKGRAIVASKDSTASKGGKTSYRSGHWRSNNRRNGTCPSYKRITGTDFICDGFHYAIKSLSENYFLTHFHSDHYGGITKTWSEGTIYCSLPTANLVHQQLGVDKRFLHPIPMNTPTVIASRGKPVTVTLLDANHCPGAIMFLFEVGSRKILHVGDFRWHREIMMSMPQLRSFGNSSPRLDELFLDTTYCNPKYTLPTQKEAISAAIEVAEREMAISKKDKATKTLFLFGSYTIGKEKIYLSVAERLKMKVYVDGRRFRILSSLEWPKERMKLFTTNKSETSLWVVPLGSVNFKQMRDYLDEGNKTKAFTAPYGRVVGFRPTGWTYSAQDKKQRTLPCGRPSPARNLISSKKSGRYSVHGVPYSEHSSFPELVDCLRCLKPKKIVPTVSVSKSEEQVELLLNAL